jgi:hypothetical protein
MQSETQVGRKLALSIEDFCRTVGVGRTVAFAEIRAGRLHARKCGRRTLITVEAAERWLASLPAREDSDLQSEQT